MDHLIVLNTAILQANMLYCQFLFTIFLQPYFSVNFCQQIQIFCVTKCQCAILQPCSLFNKDFSRYLIQLFNPYPIMSTALCATKISQGILMMYGRIFWAQRGAKISVFSFLNRNGISPWHSCHALLAFAFFRLSFNSIFLTQ